ncbi:hypothetical protein JCM8547_003655 [Rhodosporidiobolus lusitaniae]
MITLTSNGTVSAPPEVEATLLRLMAHKNVQGVLILSRPLGLILRSAGPIFALPPSASTAQTEDDGAREGGEGEEEGKEEKAAPQHSELARRYAGAAVRMVEAVGGDVRGLSAGGEDGEEDDLRFLRIRTKRHELMITPDEQYILIVVQDPGH